MSNENLNDFYNQNRFNKKLRERIDTYEPELSNSLWDRIEHDLVKKENRSKRVLWMVYAMAGLLLMSGAGLYYLASENKKLADAVNNRSERLTNKGAQEESPVFEYQMPEAIIEVSPETLGNQTGPGTISYNQNEWIPEPEAFIPDEGDIHNRLPHNILPITFSTMPERRAEESQQDIPGASSIENRDATPFSYRKRTINPHYLKEEISTKGVIYPKAQPYIGLSSEVGSTRQKLEGTHVHRFNYEHPSFYRSAGLKTGILLRSGLFIETGISFSNSGSNLWYNIVPETFIPDTTPIIAPKDSLIGGTQHGVHQQNWTDIPVQIGYRYRMNSRWSLHSQVGLTYSIINSYSGLEPNERFRGLDEAGASVPQPFQNFWSMNMALGIGYQIGKNWNIDLQGNYRRGLTNMNSVSRPNHPDRIAEYMSARVGISYIFR